MQSRFRKESLGGIDADAIATLISSAADVAMIVDAGGVIRELACDSREFEPAWLGRWVGQRWIDTVTVESRPKIQELLRDAATHEVPRGRHVNHPSSQGPDIPILYSTVRIGADGRVVAVGRDLRQAAELQQRLIEAQQSIERDYARLRHVETRYRLLFQITSEPVLIVDPASQKVVEANPAAGRLLGDTVRRIVGRPFPDGFDPQSTQAILALLAAVRASGQADSARVRLAHHAHEVQVSASLFRQESASLFLIRIVAADGETDTAAATRMNASLLKIVESAPDAFVVTGPDGRILSANASFLDLAQLGAEEQARGESLDRWLGRPGVDLNVLVANLRQHGSVRLFATTLRGEYGAAAEIEVSAVSVANGDQPCFGFTIRNIGRRLQADSRIGRELPRSVEQLTELVGRVPLKDLVRETTDVIERLCIEAALELTGDNRASAAEILGLSRQSLYVKLRRYGLGDLIAEGGE